jgi:hypothetical protein
MSQRSCSFLTMALLIGMAMTSVALALSVNGWDAAQLPETKGTVRQYTLTPRGDVDGFILTDGTEVKVPKHLSAQLVYAIRPGDAVTIRGLKAFALRLVDAATISNDATGGTVVDNTARSRPLGLSDNHHRQGVGNTPWPSWRGQRRPS